MNYTWLFLSLLAPLCFALVNTIDSHLVKKVSTTGGLVTFSGLFGFVVALITGIIAIASGHSLITDPKTVIALLIAGTLEVAWLIAYFKALETDEASSVVPWFQLIPLVIGLLGWVFLGEALGTRELIAGGFIIIGATILAIKWGESFHFKKRETGLMLVAVFIISIAAILFKVFAIEEPSFWVSSFWTSLGMGVCALVLMNYRPYRKDLLDLVRLNTKQVLGANILNEVLNAVALFSVLYAGLLVPLSYVHTVTSIQPLFVLMIDGILAFRSGDKNFFSKQTMIPLCASIFFLTIGAVIFALGEK